MRQSPAPPRRRYYRRYALLLLCGLFLCLPVCGCTGRHTPEAEQTHTDTEADFPSFGQTQPDVITLPDEEPVQSPDTAANTDGDMTLGDAVTPSEPGNRLGCVPVLRIRTQNGTAVKSDSHTVSFTMDVEKDKQTTRTGLSGQISLRGNASLGWEKKSYTISFDDKQDPVGAGRGKSRSWVLISNHCDKSLLRNYMALWMQDKLDGIAWSPWACMVDVYLNDSYIGSYLLAEKVTCASNRLNIDNESGIGADYLVELDNYASGTGEKGVTWFTARGVPYAIHGEDNLTRRRCDAVDARVTEAYDIVCSGDEQAIRALLDIPSAVDSYLVAEVTKNIDCGWSSYFLYFKDGKLHLGPLWDFDLAMGNDYRLDNGSYRRIYAGEERGFSQGNVWYIELMKQDWFVDLVTARWRELYGGGFFDAMQAELTATETVCLSSFRHNFRKWPVFTDRINQEPDALLTDSAASAEAQIDALSDWLRSRVAWLNGNGF